MAGNLLSKKEIAEYLQVSQITVDRWRKEGLPFKKAKRLVRFDIDEVKLWLESKQK